MIIPFPARQRSLKMTLLRLSSCAFCDNSFNCCNNYEKIEAALAKSIGFLQALAMDFHIMI